MSIVATLCNPSIAHPWDEDEKSATRGKSSASRTRSHSRSGSRSTSGSGSLRSRRDQSATGGRWWDHEFVQTVLQSFLGTVTTHVAQIKTADGVAIGDKTVKVAGAGPGQAFR